MCACVCMCVGLLLITNKQRWTKLPGIVAAKHKALPVMGECSTRGNSESKPLLSGHRLTLGT